MTVYGFPHKIASAINILHSNTPAKLISLTDDTINFEIYIQVSEGDTFVPFVFAAALVYALRISRKSPDKISFTLSKPRSRQHPPTILCDNEFSDNIALISNSLQ